MSVLGDFLKQTRESRNITISTISTNTAIRKEHIEMLERGEFKDMPSYVHAYGFLNKYSKEIGLDFENEVKPMFDAECNKETFGKTPEEINIEIQTRQKNNRNSRIKPILIILAVLVIGIVLVSNIVKQSAGRKQTSAQSYQYSHPIITPQAESPAPVDTAPYDPAANDPTETELPPQVVAEPEQPVQQPVAVETTKHRAILVFNDTCWVNLVVDGVGRGEDFIAENGNRKYVDFDRFFRIDVGSASAVSVIYDGRTYSGFGGWRQPIRNLYFSLNENNTLVQSRSQPR